MSEVWSERLQPSLIVAVGSEELWPKTRAATAYRTLPGYQNTEDRFGLRLDAEYSRHFLQSPTRLALRLCNHASKT